MDATERLSDHSNVRSELAACPTRERLQKISLDRETSAKFPVRLDFSIGLRAYPKSGLPLSGEAPIYIRKLPRLYRVRPHWG
jgi:hypothetical protein